MGDGILNLTIDGLSGSSEGRSLLNQLMAADATSEDVIAAWENVRPAAGVLPPGELGKLIVKEVRNEIKCMIEQLPEHLQFLGNGSDVDCDITLPKSKTKCSMRIQNVKDGAITRIRYKKFNESLQLEPWLELAILTLENQGEYCEAHIVARTDNPKKPFYKKLILQGNTPEERMKHAHLVIERVEGMYNAALHGPPPFFERASFALSTDNSKAPPGALTRKAFETDLAYSEENAFFFGDRSVDDLFGEIATKNDYKLLHRKQEMPDDTLGQDRPNRAKLYAEHVWNAFTETTPLTKTQVADTPSDVGDAE